MVKKLMIYFESHITIEPVFDERLVEASGIAEKYKFKIADLLMKKRKEDDPARSQYDTFMTGRSIYPDELQDNMCKLVKELQSKAFKVWRYKIEGVAIDSKFEDPFKLLAQDDKDVASFDE